MRPDVSLLIADDDGGHVQLIMKNLRRSGITNTIIQFKDGQEVLDFLFDHSLRTPPHKDPASYLLLLDIRMPKVDGVEVLRRLKQDREFKKIPIIMLSTTDDPRDIEQCYYWGCSSYIIKPIKYDHFVEAIQELALFLKVIEVPYIDINVTSPHKTIVTENEPDV